MESLTGLRWWAAFAVFMFHSQYFTPLPLINGNHRYWFFGGLSGLGFAGVTFFFVLSGFVLTWSHRSGDTPLRFYWRRLARIWPMIPITTLLWYPVLFADGPYPWKGLWHTLTLQQAWHADTYYAANGATWSLSCEAFFYLLFPFLVRPILRLDPRWLGMLGAVTVAVAVTAPPLFSPAHQNAGTPLYRVPEFILGVITAAAVRKGWRPSIGARTSMVPIAAAGLFIWWWFRHPYLVHGPSPFPTLQHWIWQWPIRRHSAHLSPSHVMDQVFAPLFALCIAAVAVRDIRGGKSWLRSAPMVHLGKWSFSFYMVGSMVLIGAAKWIGVRPSQTLGNIPWLLGALAVSVAISAFCFHWIEQPAERWLRGLLRPAKTKRTPEPPKPAEVVPEPAEQLV